MNEEPNYEQLIQKLPKACFEFESVKKANYKLFIVDNAIVFPDNILSVQNFALDHTFNSNPELIYFVYGKNVQIIGWSAFSSNKNLRIIRFPNLLEIEDNAFLKCYKLNQFIAPKC